MNEPKTCPKCSGEMEPGITIDHFNNVGSFSQQNTWAEKETKFLGVFQGPSKNEKKITTFRCKDCGYLESFAE